MSRTYQVKDVARIAGVSVRALHHYDELGLLVPSSRTAAGYRLYTDDDLLRLQQIVIQRELGLPLEQIRRVLDDPKFDRRAALLRQREELQQRSDRAREMIRAIDRALQEDTVANPEDLFETEARERWGETEAYRVSRERTGKYTKADWAAISAEQATIYADLSRALAAGTPPDHADVRAIVERHRLAIDRWFYPCSPAMHVGLATLYESDPRFAANIDQHGAGLAAYLVAAIRAAAAA